MLVLSRKLNQAIMIGDDVRIVVVAVDRDTVKLGIEAPRTIPVHRSEVYEEIQRTNRAAAGEAPKVTAPPEGARVADLGRGRRSPPKAQP
ncbi:MAG: carbon storage regulator CsrA [Candidatus Eremiobacteraeota bacterium]|nr:carbon storage regulator CsrA [Candidatus Eremiobacteraeota bacterium]